MAELLYQMGWQVRAPLLPGFGSGIADLNNQKRSDWIEAAATEWLALISGCQECLLVGYSMGAAVALHTAAVEKPHKMLLISPFWRAPGLYRWLVPIVRRLAPNIHLFKNADFSDARLRQFFASIMPQADLDDPTVQEYIRNDFTLPLAAMEEVIHMGNEAFKLAADLHVQTLVIQGSQDQVVLPKNTCRLVERLGEGRVCYAELPAAHDLLDEHASAFKLLESMLADFAAGGCISLSGKSHDQILYRDSLVSP